MKSSSLILAAVLALVASVQVEAATPKKVTRTKKVQTSQSTTLSRDVVFDGADVNGRYHSAGEAVAKVEAEKQLNDLIGVRRDFKDRLNAERSRLKKGEPVAPLAAK